MRRFRCGAAAGRLRPGLGWPPVVMVLEDADLKSTEVAIEAARLSIVIPPLRFPDDR